MVCEKYGQLMLEYMDGLLDDFNEMNLMKHIESCESCREDFAVYKEMLEGFGQDSVEIIEAPADFAAAVMKQVEGINLYFPEKVRCKGKIVDSVIFVIWGLLAATLVVGAVLFFYQYQIFTWMTANGLGGVATALYPVANFTTQFGATLGGYIVAAADWIITIVTAYAEAFIVAFGGLVALAWWSYGCCAFRKSSPKRKGII